MTKVSVFGKEAEEEKKKKPIEFVKYLIDEEILKSIFTPSNYENVVLLEENYTCSGLDLMWAYDNIPNNGILHLGHWNDGVV